MKCEKCNKFYNAIKNPCPCTLPRSGQFGGKCATKDTSKSGATRNAIDDLRYDLLDWDFIDDMARVMAEGAKSHGPNNWKGGFDDEGRDIDNHAIRHYRLFEGGDRSELHLAKAAIGMMFKSYHVKKREQEKDVDKFDLAKQYFSRGLVNEQKRNQRGVKDAQDARPYSG